MTALPQMNVTFDKWMLLHLWLSSKSGTPPPPFEAQMGLFFRCAFKPVKSTSYPNTALGCCINNLFCSCTCSCKLSAAITDSTGYLQEALSFCVMFHLMWKQSVNTFKTEFWKWITHIFDHGFSQIRTKSLLNVMFCSFPLLYIKL